MNRPGGVVVTLVLITDGLAGMLASPGLEELCAAVTIFGIVSTTAATISRISFLVKELVLHGRLDAGVDFFVEVVMAFLFLVPPLVALVPLLVELDIEWPELPLVEGLFVAELFFTSFFSNEY